MTRNEAVERVKVLVGIADPFGDGEAIRIVLDELEWCLEALRPFAEWAEEANVSIGHADGRVFHDPDYAHDTLTVDDFRRARRRWRGSR